MNSPTQQQADRSRDQAEHALSLEMMQFWPTHHVHKHSEDLRPI